jgi:hypothetical protein
MSTSAEHVASVLLKEYDLLTGLIELLKNEQQLILDRKTEALMLLLGKIEEQLGTIHDHQASRDEIFHDLLKQAPPPAEPGLVAQVQLLSEETRSSSLHIAQQIDIQIQLLHELTWQNHILLSRSVYFLEEVLAPWLSTERDLKIYGKTGIIQKSNKVPSPSYQAIA